MQSSARSLVCVCSAILLISPAHADITYQYYLHLEQIKSSGTAKHGANAFELDDWLDGVATGVSWSMTFAKAKGKERIICLPPTFALTSEIVHSVINQHLERRPRLMKPDTSMGHVALEGLQEMFPCQAPP